MTPDPATRIGPWEVFVVEYARTRGEPAANQVLGAHGGARIDVPYAFAAARSPRGVALIDTGFVASEGGGKAMAERFAIAAWMHPSRLLRAIGIAADDVADIVLTHAHFDHMGAISLFPRARLHIQKRELLGGIEAMALPPRFGFLSEAIDADDLHAAIAAAAEHRLNLLDGDTDDLLPGLHVRLAADSHTAGSQWVALDTARGTIVVSGDCVYSYQNLAGARADRRHMPLGYAAGGALQQLLAMDRISEAVAGDLSRIVLLHDVERWRRCETVAEIDGFRIARAA